MIDMELIEIDNTDKIKAEMQIQKVPIKKILVQHRKRWLLRTSVGDIILRKLRKLDMDEVAGRLVAESVEYLRLVKEAMPLSEKAKFEGSLTAEEMEKLSKLGKQLEPFVKCFSIRCFEEPDISSLIAPEDPIMESLQYLDAIFDSLNADEKNVLYAVLGELSKPNPDIEVDDTVLVLSQEFRIPLPADLTIETMTNEQAKVLMDCSAETARKIKSLIGK